MEKPHFHILDGLRGVAALLVVVFHVGEGFATSAVDQFLNHGYMAVDFFFVLSGFVVGYAYDDRFKDRSLTLGGFFRRRLIRLHPMVVLGAVLGALSFALQGFVKWDGTEVALWNVIVAMLLSMLMIPASPGAMHEVRGNGEMFPLNGPTWSLFFEYIANIAYALVLRRLGTRLLATFVALMAVSYATFDIFNFSEMWSMNLGWTLAGYNLSGGFLRVGLCFSMGMLLQRIFKPWRIKGAFTLCSLLLVALLAVPYITPIANNIHWYNSLYEIVCVTVAFPLIVQMGASGVLKGRVTTALCNFVGRISYPLYIVHYPVMYLLYHWLWTCERSIEATIVAVVTAVASSIVIAYVAMRFYDTPVRARLSKIGAKNKQ